MGRVASTTHRLGRRGVKVERAISEQGELKGQRTAERENETPPERKLNVGARALAPESPLEYADTLTSANQTDSPAHHFVSSHRGYRPPFASL